MDGSWRRLFLGVALLLVSFAVPAGAQAQRKGWLVFNRMQDRTVGVALVRVDGSDNKVLKVEDALDPSFSPDGKKLIFSRITPRQTTSEIVEYTLDSGEQRVMLTVPFYVFSPSWSPDGKWLTFCGLGDKMKAAVYVVDTKGGKPQVVGPQGALAPRWSPDGRKLAFCWYDEEKRKVGIGLVDPLGKGVHTNIYEHAHPVLSLAWSPDGRHIAFVQTDGTASGISFVHVIDANGGNDKTLTPTPGTRIGVEYSDDGKTLYTSVLDIPAKQSGLASIAGDETKSLFQEKGALCMMSGGFAMIWLAERAGSHAPVKPAEKATPAPGTDERKQ